MGMTIQELEQAVKAHEDRMVRVEVNLEKLSEFVTVQGAAWVRLENRMEDVAARMDSFAETVLEHSNKIDALITIVEHDHIEMQRTRASVDALISVVEHDHIEMQRTRTSVDALTTRIDNLLKNYGPGNGNQP